MEKVFGKIEVLLEEVIKACGLREEKEIVYT